MPSERRQVGHAGAHCGDGLFIQGNRSVTLAAPEGQTTTVSGVVADQNGSNAVDHPGQTPSGTSADGRSADGTSDAGIGSLVIGDMSATYTGVVDLTAENHHTGATTVASGTLLVEGSVASSTVEVRSGATLGGHDGGSGSTIQDAVELAGATTTGALSAQDILAGPVGVG